jgi:7-cyano-7-deazaguanine reductase
MMFFEQVVLLDNAINNGKLPVIETFPCPYDTSTEKSGIVRIVFPEFTCVCPKTGYPDFATIIICYLPNKVCVELKSWKLYLNSFRMIGTFHETVTHHLYKTLQHILQPQWLLVIGDFFPRGNVDTKVVFESPVSRPAGADLLVGLILPRIRSFD